jgi:A/G-specific adenine glycosylase
VLPSAAAIQQPPAGELQAAVLGWYRAEGRVLDFRATRDSYAILVSETMAQQTQIGRAVDHWRRFMARFPTFEALAAATPADVLRAWQGLGYDRRALNLLRCARIIVTELGGQLPPEVDALLRLPGIGPYTARAIAALAFGRQAGAVDVNVHRVLSRVVGGTQAGSMSRAAVQAVADALVPPDRPAEWTHALMDVGATLCRPRAPRCEACPVRTWCRYAQTAHLEATKTPVGRTDRQPRPRAARERPAPFDSTRRWLRGRILDRLRAADGDAWIAFPDPVGMHGRPMVEAALTALAREGMIELRSADPPAARLATA